MEPTKHQKLLLLNPDLAATGLLIIVMDRLGSDVLQWDPETISLELSQELGVELPPANFNKLMAAIELVTSDVFYTSLPDFIRLCNVLYNGTLSALAFDPADAAEIAWGITEALLIWPPEDNDDPVSYTHLTLPTILLV